MSNEKPSQSALPELLTAVAGSLTLALLGWWAFTLPLPVTDADNGLAPRPLLPCVMDRDGYLRGTLYTGQSEVEIDWEGSDMRCDGMYRPDESGIRMVFDQHMDADRDGLVIVMGVADAMPGEPLAEAPVNITLIDQPAGRFYVTGEKSLCFTSFSEQLMLSGTTTETWRIDGIIFCQGTLNELRGDGRLRVDEFEFSGMFRPGSGD